MGGSLSSLRDVVRQMHTIQRQAVMYTTLRIVGYLLFWKCSCFISGTENRKYVFCSYRAIMQDVSNDNRVLSLVAQSGIRNTLVTLLDQLQRCQKSLNEFLEV